MITVANGLTALRIVFVPVIASAMLDYAWDQALFFFCIAALTDVLDGAVARWRNEQTELGAYLDPVADKLLINTILVTWKMMGVPYVDVPWSVIALCLVKDFVLVLGAFILGLCVRLTIRPSWLGKMAMVAQSLLVMWMLFCAVYHQYMPGISYIFIMLVILTSCGAAAQYIADGVRSIFLWATK